MNTQLFRSHNISQKIPVDNLLAPVFCIIIDSLALFFIHEVKGKKLRLYLHNRDIPAAIYFR